MRAVPHGSRGEGFWAHPLASGRDGQEPWRVGSAPEFDLPRLYYTKFDYDPRLSSSTLLIVTPFSMPSLLDSPISSATFAFALKIIFWS